MQSILQRSSTVVIILFIISDLSVCNGECYSAGVVPGGLEGVGADCGAGELQRLLVKTYDSLYFNSKLSPSSSFMPLDGTFVNSILSTRTSSTGFCHSFP